MTCVGPFASGVLAQTIPCVRSFLTCALFPSVPYSVLTYTTAFQDYQSATSVDSPMQTLAVLNLYLRFVFRLFRFDLLQSTKTSNHLVIQLRFDLSSFWK